MHAVKCFCLILRHLHEFHRRYFKANFFYIGQYSAQVPASDGTGFNDGKGKISRHCINN